MKLFLSSLLLIVLFSCDTPINLIDETGIEDNFIPVVTINQDSQTIANGANLTLSVDIDDQDDFYHYYVWTVDGQIVSDEDEYIFSRTPEVDTDYLISVTITDGKGLATDSIIVTVLNPPWTPEPLHIYFFEVGTQTEEDSWIQEYIAVDNTQYQSFLSSTAMALQTYNRDNDPDCYRVLGGTE